MELSVIVSSYKFKDYIVQCIDSILSQRTNFEFEVIIRDDASDDGTPKLLIEKYKSVSKVRILDSSTNVGAVGNLVILMDATNGKYVAHLDGDDYLTDFHYYQRAVDFLNKNPKYAMYSSGCRYLKDSIFPLDHWIVSAKSDFELKDLLVENYVSFGRVFRNVPITKNIFDNILYPDWAFNFEIMKFGRGFCDTGNCVGLYRLHQNGMFSMTPDEEKTKNKKIMQEELSKRYNNLNRKVITILDSFVYNDAIRNKLKNVTQWMKQDGHEILLVSNTIVDQEILKNVKFYLYDHRNQLFKEKYESGNVVDFWKNISSNFVIHDIVPETQPHGLSVMINLFNAILYAKSQGYTHFQRLEIDALFGEQSRKYIKTIPDLCSEQNKKGLFYYNPSDISFHYFYSEIDAFLSKIPRITCEQDYVDYLKKYHNNKVFKIVEVFVYENLRRNNDSELLTISGEEMYKHFPDTAWNTETSASSFDKKYNGCITKLYYINEYNENTNAYERKNSYILFTYSYISRSTSRFIRCKKYNGETVEYHHSTESAGGWFMNHLPDGIQSVEVYENDKLLCEENISDCISYINLKS